MAWKKHHCVARNGRAVGLIWLRVFFGGAASRTSFHCVKRKVYGTVALSCLAFFDSIRFRSSASLRAFVKRLPRATQAFRFLCFHQARPRPLGQSRGPMSVWPMQHERRELHISASSSSVRDRSSRRLECFVQFQSGSFVSASNSGVAGFLGIENSLGFGHKKYTLGELTSTRREVQNGGTWRFRHPARVPVLISALCRCLVSSKSWGNGRVKLGGHWGRLVYDGRKFCEASKEASCGVFAPYQHFR